jgi:hypothetical protein
MPDQPWPRRRMEEPSHKRIVVSIVVALCGGALLYVARSILTEKPLVIGTTSIAAVMIGGGIGSVFRWQIVGALLCLALYGLYLYHCAMVQCVPDVPGN